MRTSMAFGIALILLASSQASAQYVYGPSNNPQSVTGTANNSGSYSTSPPFGSSPSSPSPYQPSSPVTGSTSPYGGLPPLR